MKKIIYLCLIVVTFNQVLAQNLTSTPSMTPIVSAGGDDREFVSKMTTDHKGNFYITGSYYGSSTFGTINTSSKGFSTMYVAKFDSTGILQWVQTAQGGTDDVINTGESIAVDSSDNVYVIGSYEGPVTIGSKLLTPKGGSDIFLVKYDSNGVFQWVLSEGGTSNDNAKDILVDNNGNIFATGIYRGTATFGSTTKTVQGDPDIFVAKYDGNGSLTWLMTTGGEGMDDVFELALDTNDNIYLVGNYNGTTVLGTTTLTGKGYSDVFVAKYDVKAQNWSWVVSAGGIKTDYGRSIALDASGNVFITGTYTEKATFGSTVINGLGEWDAFTAKYDNNGVLIWVKSMGGTDFDVASGITADKSGNIYVTGHYTGTAQFESRSITSQGNTDLFVTKYDNNGNFQWVQSAGASVNEYGMNIITDYKDNIYMTGTYYYTVVFGKTAKTAQGNSDVFIVRIDK